MRDIYSISKKLADLFFSKKKENVLLQPIEHEVSVLDVRAVVLFIGLLGFGFGLNLNEVKASVDVNVVNLSESSKNFYVDEAIDDRKNILQQLSNSDGGVFHLFSHGRSGELFIDGKWLSVDSLVSFLKPLTVGVSQLNIYGCEFAKGDIGRAAVMYLESALGIKVLASDDITGIDGDWELEVGSGVLASLELLGYEYNLQAAACGTDDLFPLRNDGTWSATATSALNLNGIARFAIDNRVNTIWHTAAPVAFPQAMTVDLGGEQPLGGIQYFHATGALGRVQGYEIYTSTDNATYTLQTSGVLTQPVGANYLLDAQLIQFPATVNARYYRFVATSAASGYAIVAETIPMVCGATNPANIPEFNLAQCNANLLNTGHDSNTSGTVDFNLKQYDQQWMVARIPTYTTDTLSASEAVTAWQHAVVSGDVTGNIPGSASGNWFNSPFNNAEWITSSITGQHGINNNIDTPSDDVDYLYRLDFNMDFPDAKLLSILSAVSMNFYSDNSVWDIVVNGTSLRLSGDYPQLPTSGANTSRFVVYNSTEGYVEGNNFSLTIASNLLTLGINSIYVHVKSGNPFVGYLAQIFGSCGGVDFGDAPDSDYGTTLSASGPIHPIINVPDDGNPNNGIEAGSLLLGAVIDNESDGQPTTEANGDGSDEDGIGNLPLYSGSGVYIIPVSVTNTTSNPAQLVGWLDWGDGGASGTGDNSFSQAIDRSSPALRAIDCNDDGILDTLPSGSSDTTFSSGNIPAGCVGTAYLQWISAPMYPNGTNFTMSTYLRLRITTDGHDTGTGFFSDDSPESTGAVTDGEVEDHLVSFSITPVTLSHFSSNVSSGMVDLDWGTSSELFNVGFQLWGLDGADGGWKKLHNWLVKSGNGNAIEPQSYRKRVKIPNSIDQLISVGISSVDSDGSEHYYGPFELGKAYGDLDQMEPIAWDKVRSELDTRMTAAGYVKDRVNGYRKVSVDTSAQALSGSSASSLETVVEFSVSSDGLYRITSAELAAADIDWSGALKRDIAVIDTAGEPVVRYVKSGRKFGTGGEIYVYGHSPDERAGLYTDQQVYRLVLDRNRALNAPKQGKSGVSSGFSPSYTEASMVENDRQYIFHSAADDPWVSAVVMSEAGKPRLHGLSVPMEADADLSQSLVLHLGLGKSSDLPGVGDEHVVRGAVLSEGGLLYLGSQTSNDTGLWDVEIEIPGNTPLTLNDAGHPIVGGEYSPGSGYGFSQVHVDRIGLSYARPYVPKHGDHHLEFSAPDEGELGYEVVLPDDGYPWVFASDGDNLVRIVPESARRSTDGAGNRVRTVRFGSLLGSTGSDVGLQYWVGARQQALSVNGLGQREIATQASLLAQVQGSNYVMIAHPTFMGDALNRYADHKRGEGYRVSLINYLDVVDAYGGGQAGPVGLTAYLSALEAQGVGIEYVLMVGGSTYDHTGNGSSGAITFIPAHYGESDYSKFTVSDAPYVMDGDGHAFASIGRWPVRSVSDVETIVDKSIVWSSKDHSSGEALLIAEHTVDGEGIDFGLALDGVAASLPVSYNQTQVYVDRIMAENPQFTLTQALSRAKSQIIAGLNQGPDVVLYNGHASTRQLSNQNLLKSGDVSQVTSAGAEVWIPLSCYVTFFENTDVNSLSYQLMFSGNAVGITGAMLLSNQGENLQMGASILEGTMNNGMTLGDAVNNAKAALNNPNVNINWNYLGDPTTSF